MDGWIQHGISKFVNKDSRPWFAPIVKYHRRNSRFWAGRIAKMRASGAAYTVVEGVFYTLDQCHILCKREAAAYFDSRDSIVQLCEQYLGKLLDNDCHAALKRIYQSRHKTVPVLKRRKQEGKGFTKLADTAQTKAEVFSDQFLKNTQLPCDFPPDTHHNDVDARLRSNMKLFYFDDQGQMVSHCNFGFNNRVLL